MKSNTNIKSNAESNTKSLIICLMIVAMVLLPQLLSAVGTGSFQIERLVTFLAMGTGATTGTYFPLGNAFANVWTTRSGNVNVMSHSTRGSIDNIRLLQRHELNLAIAQSDIVASAIKGTGSFAGEAYPELRVLMALYPEVIQVVVVADSDIKSIEQLRNRKVIVGAPGSGNVLTSFEILSACGIKADEFEPVYISYDEAIQAMERREYDAAIIIAGIPTRMVSELQRRIKTRILSFSPQEVASLTSALPYLSPLAIPAATYVEQTGAIDTIALTAMLISNTRLSDDLAYSLSKTLFDNLDYLQKIHERARDISIDTFMNGVPEGYLHSGSQRFYQARKSGR